MIDRLVQVSDAGGSVRATLTGELDLATVPAVEAALAPALTRHPRALVLDVRQVRFLDSTALRMLFRLAAEQRSRRGSLVVVAPAGTLARRVLDMAALGAACEIVEAPPSGA